MTTLLLLIYLSACIVVFRVFRVRLNKWTVTTAAVAGLFIVGGILIMMNYNHPFTTEARLYFYATPITPSVNGEVIEVPVAPNVPVRKGDVLFRLDPRPFEYAVAQRKAALAEAKQEVLERKAALKAATALVAQSQASRDQAKDEYQRYADADLRGGRAAPFSEAQVENRRQVYLSAEAALATAIAQEDQARLAATSEIDGTDTNVAELEAQLQRAAFELEQSVYRAPTDGYATQIFLRPGMRAVNLPLVPIMTFVHSDRYVFAAAFKQAALQRVAPGDLAEISFAAIPGRVFHGKVDRILQAMAEGQLEPSGRLMSPPENIPPGRFLAVIDVVDDLSAFQLPGGSTAEVAVYTNHWKSFAEIRKILIRMRAWLNYATFDR
ncbi:HlyD family secretion protein [Mesorhizobium sp. 1B3]|uniref:HlyD family secretion protein n=1 Tax=Mesorhizobium sp. 1B3 TaxID=3243599 RepID=UPI003D9A0849